MTAGVLFVQPSKGSPTLAALYRTRAKHRFSLTLTSPADLSKTKRYTVDVKPGKESESLANLLDSPAHFTVKVKRKMATFNTTLHADSGLIRFESKAMSLTYTPADLGGKADPNGTIMLLSVIGMLTHGDAGGKFSVRVENGSATGAADVKVTPADSAAKPAAKTAPAAKPAKKSAVETAPALSVEKKPAKKPTAKAAPAPAAEKPAAKKPSAKKPAAPAKPAKKSRKKSS